MNILLSAYACEPGIGSEPGLGWDWAVQLSRAGNNVWVLTRSVGRTSIENKLREEPVPNLQFVYYDLPHWLWPADPRAGMEQLHYQIWQWGVYRVAKALARAIKFDVVHHITFAVFRHHSLLPFLGIPFVFGPVGGGENTPRLLRASLPLRGRMRDAIRDFINRVALLDPILRSGLDRAKLILCKTPETMAFIPQQYRHKARLQLETGIVQPRCDEAVKRADENSFRLIFAGRLLYLKGIHIAIKAFARVLAVMPYASFTVVGDGPDKQWLEQIAERANVRGAIQWVPRIPREKLLENLSNHELFLFPSLHDSGGSVVFEALSAGVPVVCLDLGGPAQIVNDECGCVISTSDADEDEVVERLATQLISLARNRDTLDQLKKGCRKRIAELSWETVINRVYSSDLCAIGAQMGD